MDIDPDTKTPPSKPPVVRGARACTVCRAAKMKCVGADDGQKPCQRCKRANVECIFEKHRRGRKPGSKLSEASKMLRRLEKGLTNAKLKSQSAEAAPSGIYPPPGSLPPPPDTFPGIRPPESPYAASPTYATSPTNRHYPANNPPSINISPYQNGDTYPSASTGGPRSIDPDDEEDDDDKNEAIFPAKLIRQENARNSFFRTILNPSEEAAPAVKQPLPGTNVFPPPNPRLQPIPPGPLDPISAGILAEEDVKLLFDLLFLRLNPFINLFDPALHTAPYVRARCPFLFTTLIMVCCKFWRPKLFKQCQKLANEFAVRAFAEAWKRVEVVQAFACLTYWKEPDDNRTWTYIGYGCRMAVELGLNRYVAHPPVNETDFQKLERRNRERTYLVLFIHDRSLSTQTGRHWMLPEGELVKHSTTWHTGGINGIVRPEDVIIAAFVQLRLIAAETTDIFSTAKGNNDINFEVVLRNCNSKLTQWDETWRSEMVKAKGETFHLSFLTFFRLYVRLFLNSFGIQSSLIPGSRQPPSLQALTTCYTSALDSLKIVSEDFVKMSMLCYGQDSITVMSAYSAVFLLKLLRTPTTYSQIGEQTANDIYRLIDKTAQSFLEASGLSEAATSPAYHGRFLQSLLANDIFRHRSRTDRERDDNGVPIDPRLQNQPMGQGPVPPDPTQAPYPHPMSRMQDQGGFHFPASPNMPAHPQTGSVPPNAYHSEYANAQMQAAATNGAYYNTTNLPSVPHNVSELDAHYWKNMFIELGFGENHDSQTNVLAVGTSDVRTVPHYLEHHHQAQQQQQQQHQQQHPMQQGPVYHNVHPASHPPVHPSY